jgi:hypothetical protein
MQVMSFSRWWIIQHHSVVNHVLRCSLYCAQPTQMYKYRWGEITFLFTQKSQFNIFTSHTFHVGCVQLITRESASYSPTTNPLGVPTILVVKCMNFSFSLSCDIKCDAFCFLYSSKLNIQCFLYPSLFLYLLYHSSLPNGTAHKQSLNLATVSIFNSCSCHFDSRTASATAAQESYVL